MGNCGGRPAGGTGSQSNDQSFVAAAAQQSSRRANSPEEAVNNANFQSISPTEDEEAAIHHAAATRVSTSTSPSQPKPNISRQTTHTSATGRSSMRKTTSRQITTISSNGLQQQHHTGDDNVSSSPPHGAPTQLVRVRSVQQSSPRQHVRHASGEKTDTTTDATTQGDTTTTTTATTTTTTEKSPRTKQRTFGTHNNNTHLNSSATTIAQGTGSHRTKRRLVRRTSHKGMLSALALKFPMIRASFVAVHRVFEQYHRERMQQAAATVNSTASIKSKTTATASQQKTNNATESQSSQTRRNTEFDKQAITQDKLKDVLQVIASHKQFTDDEVKSLFALSDLDGSATISFREFLIVVACGYFLKVDPSKDADAAADTSFMSIRKGFKAIEDAFNEMDEDKSGTVDASELKRALFESTPAPAMQSAGSISPVLAQHTIGSPSSNSAATPEIVAAAARQHRKRNSLDAAPRRSSTQNANAALGGTTSATPTTGQGAIAAGAAASGVGTPQLQHRRTRSQSLATAQQTAETNHAALMAKRFAELDFNEDGSVELGEFIFGIVSWVSFMDDDDD
jgi:Ca2+-binding EF-hand superfamily protein